ncbi:MAG: hypothetical protein FWH18_03115 [Marinilabiliaceae bacterium]|nr:hypothetical protein [Marinilabiliaceae bacterium]
MKRIKIFLLGLMAVGMLLLSYSCTCQGNKKGTVEKDLVDSLINGQLLDDFHKSKLIFYSLPSPLETATLIKKSGATYDADLLNSVDNVSKYNTNLKMALNLGVYSSDLSYTSLFDQNQSTISYMNVIRKLAEQLGILGAIDESTIKKLEQNINNRDVVLEIISETFMNSNAYLTENDRPAIVAMVLVGGWIEGLFLATQLAANASENNHALVERIIYQKLSLEIVMNLLETYKNSADIVYLLEKMSQLQVIYDEIQITSTSNVEVETIPDKQTTIIRSDAEVFITPEVFKRLVVKLKEIRSEFVS